MHGAGLDAPEVMRLPEVWRGQRRFLTAQELTAQDEVDQEDSEDEVELEEMLYVSFADRAAHAEAERIVELNEWGCGNETEFEALPEEAERIAHAEAERIVELNEWGCGNETEFQMLPATTPTSNGVYSEPAGADPQSPSTWGESSVTGLRAAKRTAVKDEQRATRSRVT